MRSLKFILKVTRLEQCLIVGVSTWLIALLSNGPLWCNTPKVAAGVSMFFSCLGASLLHYGRRHDVYERKWYDRVVIQRPLLFISLGTLAFGLSMYVAGLYLPAMCFAVALFNFLVILLYANFLDQYWPFKNLAIACVCVTPIVMGWYSGHRMHPMVPYLMSAVFFAYTAREVMKDISDRLANKGKRFTMVMSIGIRPSLRIAGILLVAAIVSLLLGLRLMPWTLSPSSMTALIAYGIGSTVLCFYANKLLRAFRVNHYYQFIDFSVLSLMVSVLALRING